MLAIIIHLVLNMKIMISSLKVYTCRSVIFKEGHFYFVFITVRDLTAHCIFLIRTVKPFCSGVGWGEAEEG